jgi:hypothetical protein
MADQLAGGRYRRGEAKTKDDVIEALLEQREKIPSGRTSLPGGAYVVSGAIE